MGQTAVLELDFILVWSDHDEHSSITHETSQRSPTDYKETNLLITI